MIDWSKPIECVDGTPATYLRLARASTNVLVDTPAHPYGSNLQNTERVYAPDGSTTPFPENPPLRNKEMKMIDKNKPVQCGGQDAKIVHTFDNGNMVVVVDGSTQVHNFTPDGRPVGGRGLILTNKVERTERWFCANLTTYSVGAYSTLAAVRVYADRRSGDDLTICHQILENGRVVSTESVS